MSYLNSKFLSGFSPQNIPGLALWLDAADSNSITRTGANVTGWRDKSPYGCNAVVFPSAPTGPTVSTLNGVPVLNFVATSQQCLQVTPPTTLSTSTGLSMFTLFRYASSLTYAGSRIYEWRQANRLLAASATTAPYSLYYNLKYTDNSITATSNTYALNTPYAVSYVETGLNAIINLNAAQGGSNVRAVTSNYSTIYFGYSGNTTVGAYDFFDGQIGEFIIFNRSLTTAETQLMEAYLGWKWGLISSFPAASPFRSVVPAMRPFNPLDISGCALWLDSADYGSFTFSSGTSVSQWNDKSGNGRNFSQATAGNQPTWSNSFLSSPGVYFNSANSQRLSGTYVQAGTGGRHTYIVFYDSNTTANLYGNPPLLYMADSNSTGAGADWRAAVDASNNYLSIDIFAGAKTMRTSPNVTSMRTQRCIALWGMPTGATVDTTYVYGNGTQFTTSVASVNLTQTINTFNTSLTTIGGYAVGSSWVNAVISEIIHYSNELTSNQRQQVELYLAEKWGLRGNLASSNTLRLYESLSPVFNPTLLSNCTLWLDAADDGTMTFTGANLSTWRDKSGSGNNGAAVGTITKTGTINGTSVLQWTLASGANYVYGTLSNSTTSASLFAVFNMSSTTATFARALSVDPNGRDWTAPAGVAAIMKYGPFVSQRSDTLTSSSVTSNYDAPVIVSTMFDGTSNYMHVNGTAGSNGASAGSFSYLRYGVGRDNAGDGPSMIGSYAEVLHFPRFLTTAERQLVEGYLAQKWNISLPSTHPYKTIRV